MKTRTDVFEAKGRESFAHLKADFDVPMTREGFEGILSLAAQQLDLPVDDELRMVFAGYIHSLDRKISDFNTNELLGIIRKSYSNQLTYQIIQEIDAKVKAERAANPNLTVVSPNEETAP